MAFESEMNKSKREKSHYWFVIYLQSFSATPNRYKLQKSIVNDTTRGTLKWFIILFVFLAHFIAIKTVVEAAYEKP